MNCHIHLIKKALHSPGSEPIKLIGAKRRRRRGWRTTQHATIRESVECSASQTAASLQEATEGGRN